MNWITLNVSRVLFSIAVHSFTISDALRESLAGVTQRALFNTSAGGWRFRGCCSSERQFRRGWV